MPENEDRIIPIKFKRLHDAAVLPARAKPGDAGFDLAYPGESRALLGYEQAVIPLGIASEIPPGWAALIVGRSGLACLGVDVLGGLIDRGYRGEWKVILSNQDINEQQLGPGDKIAQFILVPVPDVACEWADDLAPSERGSDGFGSTDKPKAEVEKPGTPWVMSKASRVFHLPVSTTPGPDFSVRTKCGIQILCFDAHLTRLHESPESQGSRVCTLCLAIDRGDKPGPIRELADLHAELREDHPATPASEGPKPSGVSVSIPLESAERAWRLIDSIARTAPSDSPERTRRLELARCLAAALAARPIPEGPPTVTLPRELANEARDLMQVMANRTAFLVERERCHRIVRAIDALLLEPHA